MGSEDQDNNDFDLLSKWGDLALSFSIPISLPNCTCLNINKTIKKA